MDNGEKVSFEEADLTDWNKIKEEIPFDNKELDKDAEIDKKCREAIEMAKVPEGFLKQDFPSSTYLFHSAKVEQIDEIFKSGQILNAGAIYGRKIENERKRLLDEGKTAEEIEQELKKVSINYNSGQEGISWSVNGIDAMPGTTGHIAGFVAAPEMVLGKDKLIIPSRPAPYELLQVSEEVDAEKFCEAKKQFEVWGYKDVSLGEKASVDGGMLALILTAKDRKDEEPTGFFSSQLERFKNRGGLAAEELRKHYKNTEDGHLVIDEDLHQQKFDDNYLPPAAIFIQALIDRGEFKNTLVEGKDTNGIIEMCFENDKLPLFILGKARQESKYHLEIYEEELKIASDICVKVQDMYFVTCRRDLDRWFKKIKETGNIPKGILLYDENKIVKENFAQLEPGDHLELMKEIGHTVGVDNNFWSEKIGMDVEKIERAGHMGQVLKDSEINHKIEVKLVGGELQIIKH